MMANLRGIIFRGLGTINGRMAGSTRDNGGRTR